MPDPLINISDPAISDDNALLHTFLNINTMPDNNIIGGNEVESETTPTLSGNQHPIATDINSCNGHDIAASHSINLNTTGGYEVTLNPCSLKETYLQCLSSNARSLKPPSLYELSIDFMAWNSTKRFNCSMLLPKSTFTINTTIELIRPPSNDPSYSTQVTLYDNMKVDSKVKEYLFKQAKTRKYAVTLNPISTDLINTLKASVHESWHDLDPYSGIEDIGDTSDDDTVDAEHLPVPPLQVETTKH